jgi:hypothetical protein
MTYTGNRHLAPTESKLSISLQTRAGLTSRGILLGTQTAILMSAPTFIYKMSGDSSLEYCRCFLTSSSTI